MKTKETFTTSDRLLAAYLLAKDLKLERIEVVLENHFTSYCFHFPEEETKKILRDDDTVNFTDLKMKQDFLYNEIIKTRHEFRKQGGAQ